MQKVEYRKRTQPIGSACDLGAPIDFAISGNAGSYKAFFAPVIIDGIFVDLSSAGSFAEDAFPYYDVNEPYPQVYPFGMSTLMTFPAPPIVDYCGIAGTTPQCPDDNSRALRKNSIQQFTAANQTQLFHREAAMRITLASDRNTESAYLATIFPRDC